MSFMRRSVRCQECNKNTSSANWEEVQTPKGVKALCPACREINAHKMSGAKKVSMWLKCNKDTIDAVLKKRLFDLDVSGIKIEK